MTNIEVMEAEFVADSARFLSMVAAGATVIVGGEAGPVAEMRPVERAASGLVASEHAAAYGSLVTPSAGLMRLISQPAVRGVLAVFLRDPDTALHQREIARRTELGLRSAQLALQKLQDLGLVAARRDGNRKYYSAVRTERFEELRGTLSKEIGLVEVVARALAPLSDRIEWAAVFGSVASGTDRVASDVDVIVVGDVSLDELSEPIARAQRELEREIDLITYRPAVFASKKAEGNHFVRSVLDGPRIDVIGAPE